VFRRLYHGPVVDSRRSPVQARSRLLVESVVTGTRTLLRTTNPESITTAMIATEAGCSPAAFYRFFADRESIFETVADALQEDLRSTYSATFTRLASDATLRDAIDLLVDTTASAFRREPAFRMLRWRDRTPTPTSQRSIRATNDHVAELLWNRFGRRRTTLRPTFHTAVEAAGHIVGLAFEQRASGDRRMLIDAKRMTELFLTDALAPPKRPPAKRATARG
jgi:AcrR family transcriptional regulator